jgi:hypothetical protein
MLVPCDSGSLTLGNFGTPLSRASSEQERGGARPYVAVKARGTRAAMSRLAHARRLADIASLDAQVSLE